MTWHTPRQQHTSRVESDESDIRSEWTEVGWVDRERSAASSVTYAICTDNIKTNRLRFKSSTNTITINQSGIFSVAKVIQTTARSTTERLGEVVQGIIKKKIR